MGGQRQSHGIRDRAGHEPHSTIKLYSDVADFSTDNLTAADVLDELAEIVPSLITQASTRNTRGTRDIIVQDVQFSADSATAWSALLSGTRARNTREADAYRAPVLSIHWRQGAPYNNMTPLMDGKRTLVGCVAIAMSQVMRHWQWPARGQGSTSYQWRGQTLSTSFERTYPWSSLLPTYTGGEGSLTELATTLRDVGYSVKMDYAPDGSSASEGDALSALKNNWQYGEAQLSQHGNQSDDSWFNAMRAELDLSPPRPVLLNIYTSRRPFSTQTGHAVVVDGYKVASGSKYVHINMGWGGGADGWYSLNNIVAGGYSFTSVKDQSIITHLHPPAPASPTGGLETLHPYADSTDKTWVATLAGNPASVNVTFDPSTKVESYYDRIYVMDSAGTSITGSPFTGTSLAGRTVNVPGATVRIRLTSDYSVQDWGFRATVAAGPSITPPSSGDGGPTVSLVSKNTLEDTSADAPALTYATGRDRVLLAFTENQPTKRLVVRSGPYTGTNLSDRRVLSETTGVAPALGSYRGEAWLGWAGSGNRYLCVLPTEDGLNFSASRKVVNASETTTEGPAVDSFNDQLAVVWTGVGNRQMCVQFYQPNGTAAGTKTVLADTSSVQPAASHDSLFNMVGVTSDKHPFIKISTNGSGFVTDQVFGNESTNGRVAVSHINNKVVLAFTGTDGRLNLLIKLNGTWYKRILPETSERGPALANVNGRLFLAWTGAGNHMLNVAIVNGI